MGSGKLWLHGLIAAFIGGGASAITSGFVASQLMPDRVNLGAGLFLTLKLIGATFVISGVLSAAAYLKQSPVPNDWDGTDRRGETPPAPPKS